MPIFKKTAKGAVKYFPIPFAFAGQSPDFAKLPAHTSTLPAAYRAVCRSVLIKGCQIALGIAVPMLCGTLCPVKCPFKVLANPQPFQIKISNLTFCQRIPLLCQRKVSVKAFIILLGVPVHLDQTVTFFQFGRWFIIPCCHRNHFLSVAKFSESAPKEISPL